MASRPSPRRRIIASFPKGEVRKEGTAMKKLFAMLLALTMTFQLITPAWADAATEEPEEVTEASEVVEEVEETEEDVPEEETTEPTEEEPAEETTEATEEALPKEPTEAPAEETEEPAV